MVDNLTAFQNQYIETLLWCSVVVDETLPEGEGTSDGYYSNADDYELAEGQEERLLVEARDFYDWFTETYPEWEGDYGQVGHDFALTRNGHGAGFWDRGDETYSKSMRDETTEMSKVYGGVYLYLGDDGYLYAMGLE